MELMSTTAGQDRHEEKPVNNSACNRELIMNRKRWEHFEHMADIGVRGIGNTREEAFEQAAEALPAVVTDLKAVRPDKAIQVACQAPDQELLFVDWLNALVFEMAVRKTLFSRFEVRIKGLALHGKAWGEEIDEKRHQPAVEIKGATLTSLAVFQNAAGAWVAQCVVDV